MFSRPPSNLIKAKHVAPSLMGAPLAACPRPRTYDTMPRELLLTQLVPPPRAARSSAAARTSVISCVAPQHRSSKSRGKALLQGQLRPGEADDQLLIDVTNEFDTSAKGEGIEAVGMVQWYPGHIAKAERALKEQLKAVDLVLEVRDGRIPMSTRHPQIPQWSGGKPRLMLLNRRDMISDSAAGAWTTFFRERGHHVRWTNAHRGDGVAALTEAAVAASEAMNEKRLKRGLRPRPVRAVVVGFPNVGKSALINRLLGRRMADSAPRPGVTRVLKWMRIGGELDLLDAPGIIPMSFKDQLAAQRLAMCNDIGEASYVSSSVASVLLATMKELPNGDALMRRVEERYKLHMRSMSEEEYIVAVGDKLFNRETERAGQRILKDFRSLVFGPVCLEMPDAYSHYKDV